MKLPVMNFSITFEIISILWIVVPEIIKLFINLNNNIYLIPYSVKCICKIILILLKKKFPNINIIEQNTFISKFFFCKLFLPIFKNPGFEALINNFIISGTTIYNLNIISFIIEKFISGTLIKSEEENGDYIPFNMYFLEKMPDALEFFDNITKVKLPPFIEKLINGNLPNDFEFNYFTENPDEVVFHRSICCSMDDFIYFSQIWKNVKINYLLIIKLSFYKKLLKDCVLPQARQ